MADEEKDDAKPAEATASKESHFSKMGYIILVALLVVEGAIMFIFMGAKGDADVKIPTSSDTTDQTSTFPDIHKYPSIEIIGHQSSIPFGRSQTKLVIVSAKIQLRPPLSKKDNPTPDEYKEGTEVSNQALANEAWIKAFLDRELSSKSYDDLQSKKEIIKTQLKSALKEQLTDRMKSQISEENLEADKYLVPDEILFTQFTLIEG